MTVARTAAMACGAVAIDGTAVAIMAGADTLTVNGRTATAAGVRIAATGVAVAVASLAGGWSEDGKTGGEGQQGDELFHDECWFAFDWLPHPCGVFIRRGAAVPIRDSAKHFLCSTDSQRKSWHEDLRVLCARQDRRLIHHSRNPANQGGWFKRKPEEGKKGEAVGEFLA